MQALTQHDYVRFLVLCSESLDFWNGKQTYGAVSHFIQSLAGICKGRNLYVQMEKN